MSTTTDTTLTLTSAREALERLHQKYSLVPVDSYDEITSTMRYLVATAAASGVLTVAGLATHASEILTDVTGQNPGEPTCKPGQDDTHRLHQTRNCLAALLAVTATTKAARSAALGTCRVQVARTSWNARPMIDDEGMLMRIQAFGKSCETDERSLRSGLVYALFEAGLDAHEISSVTLDDLEGNGRPSAVSAAGHGERIKSRRVPLDHFAGTIVQLARAAAERQGADPCAPLAYTPRTATPGSKSAYMSVHGVINGSLKDAGLKHADVTAKSVSNWRQRNTHDHLGADGLRALTGRESVELIQYRLYRPRELRTMRTAAPPRALVHGFATQI